MGSRAGRPVRPMTEGAAAAAALRELARELATLRELARVRRRALADLPLGKPARRALDEEGKGAVSALTEALALLAGDDGDTVADWLALARRTLDRLPAAAAAAQAVPATDPDGAPWTARELADLQEEAAQAIMEAEP